jgi:predicted metal-dependent hydrolase
MSDLGIPYTIHFSSRSKRLTIKVDSTGEVIVTAPERFPKYKIAEYVESARGWISAAKAERGSKPVLLSVSSAYYLGTEYAVKVSRRFDGSVSLGKEVIIVAPLASTNVKKATLELLSSWLKSRAIEYITRRVYELAATMQLSFSGLAFKQQKTRWGSCSSQRNLNFNWKLIHAPTVVIDYVIIHELAHLVHMNHGRAFWDLVARFDPDHAEHRRWLERNGSATD